MATLTIQTHFARNSFVVVIILLTDLMVIFKAEEITLFIPFTVNLNKKILQRKNVFRLVSLNFKSILLQLAPLGKP